MHQRVGQSLEDHDGRARRHLRGDSPDQSRLRLLHVSRGHAVPALVHIPDIVRVRSRRIIQNVHVL